jgi:hypothetical protein
MSSVETPDDREPPPFNFYKWMIDVATFIAVIALALMTYDYFFTSRPILPRAPKPMWSY